MLIRIIKRKLLPRFVLCLSEIKPVKSFGSIFFSFRLDFFSVLFVFWNDARTTVAWPMIVIVDSNKPEEKDEKGWDEERQKKNRKLFVPSLVFLRIFSCFDVLFWRFVVVFWLPAPANNLKFIFIFGLNLFESLPKLFGTLENRIIGDDFNLIQLELLFDE